MGRWHSGLRHCPLTIVKKFFGGGHGGKKVPMAAEGKKKTRN